MSNWPLFQESEKINNIFETTPEQDYWINIFETLYSSNFPDFLVLPLAVKYLDE